MKNKLERELEQKEFENQIKRDLKIESEIVEYQERSHRYKNKYIISATYFFSTLFICYLFFFMARIIFNFMFGMAVGFMGIDLGWIAIPVHAAIWIIAVTSAIKRKSVLDNILHRII